MNVTLIRIDAQDASGGALPVFLSSHDRPEACHIGGDQWDPALATLPAFALDFFGGGFAGQVTAPRTGFTVATTGLAAFGSSAASRARFADARVRIWHGDITNTATVDLGPLTLRFDGRIIAEPEVDEATRTARFEAAVQDSWADKPLLALFAGTGGIEGPVDLTGQVKPLVLGNVRFAGGTLIDQVDNVWMVSDGPVQAVNAAYDRLASLGASAGNFADLAALKAASIPNGSWGTCLAQGLVRFGAPPDGRVSFDVSGSNSGTGGYVRLPGAIIRRLADRAGGTVNAASLAALDTARPYNLQLQLREQVTAREVIAQVADSVAAVAGVSLKGELFAQALSIGTPSDTLAADDSSAQRVVAVEELTKAAPSWRLATEAELTFEVHSADEAAFDYRWQGEYSAARVYRLDDVVTGPDGAAWAYIAASPAAGAALPIWPVTSNASWQLFQRPGSAGVAPANANRVPFSRMEGGIGWLTSFTSMPITTATRPVTTAGRTFIRTDAAPTASGQQMFVRQANAQRFSVTAGERLSVSVAVEVQALTGAAPGFWQVYLEYLNSAGSVLTSQQIASGTGAVLATVRHSIFATVPANAVQAQMVLRADATGAGTLYTALEGPMVAASATGQTVHPAFVPGPNARDGADPNNLITIDSGTGVISGIGSANIPVDNRRTALQGLASARPASGQFIGQEYHATDTGVISQWDGLNWRNSADITFAVSGPADLTLNYASDLTLTSPLPVTATYSLAAAGAGALTSGVTWGVTAISGTFSGTAPSIVGTGSGQLRINSAMTSPTAELRITATFSGRTYPAFTVSVRRNVAPPATGGGGTGSSPPATGSLTSISTSTFTRMHASDLTVTLGSGVTSVALVASGELAVSPELPTGSTTVEGKWQRESSPGVWSDVGSVATSSPSPSVSDYGLTDGLGNPLYSADPGSISCNRTATGLTGGSTQKFRFVARVSAGNVRTVSGSGSVSATP